MTALDSLIERLEQVRVEHNRLASWNREKGRAARCAFHHDASLAIRDAVAQLKAKEASQ